MTAPRKNVTSTYTDPESGKFAKGNPGRPKGARHRSSLAIENLLAGQVEALGEKALELALAGDIAALKLCLDRILPPRRDAPVEFDLPAVNGAKDAAKAAQSVLEAVSDGGLTPTEGAVVMSLVERYGRVLELSEFEGRLIALERATEVVSK